jgi:hypothetical protein
MSAQLRLLASPVAAPTVTGLWADLGAWMVGGPEPLVLVAHKVAATHRARVRALMGRA